MECGYDLWSYGVFPGVFTSYQRMSEFRRCCCGRERSPSGVTNDKRLELKETMIVLTGGSILGACLVDIGEPYEVKLATFYGS